MNKEDFKKHSNFEHIEKCCFTCAYIRYRWDGVKLIDKFCNHSYLDCNVFLFVEDHCVCDLWEDRQLFRQTENFNRGKNAL